MKFFKRVIIGAIAGVMGLSIMGISAFAYGSDNNIGYSYTVPGRQAWGYSSEQYRGPSNTSVPWKVNFTYSSEGPGTFMQYFLLAGGWDYTRLSDYKNVKQGSGSKYYHAYDAAYNRDVRLGARNNNNTPNSYTVSGYWDEESAKHVFSDWN